VNEIYVVVALYGGVVCNTWVFNNRSDAIKHAESLSKDDTPEEGDIVVEVPAHSPDEDSIRIWTWHPFDNG